MEKSTNGKDLSGILAEFRAYVNEHLPPFGGNRNDYIHEILVQGYKEILKRPNENPLAHLRLCFPNLCKRARTELSQADSLTKNKAIEMVSLDFTDEPPSCIIYINSDFLVQEYIAEIRTKLTKAQLKVFDWVLAHPGCKKRDALAALGYHSEAGFRQIMYRIRDVVDAVIKQ